MKINGEFLKEVRVSRKFKKSEVSRAVGITSNDIKRIEDGTAVTLKNVIKLADFYGLTLGEVLEF